MVLVAYPDSDSDDGDGAQAIAAQPLESVSNGAPKRKRKRKRNEAAQDDLPPLPAAFHDLYTTNSRVSTSDDPSLHGGRKRAIPHVEGNWPSHVYLEWNPSQAESDALHRVIRVVRDAVDLEIKKHQNKAPVPNLVPSLQSELGAPLPLHVSLSRTLQIRTEDREVFLETLISCLRKAAIQSFHFRFQGLKWVPNFERNRWFLVLSIEKPAHDELNRLLAACNKATGRCGHPGLYIGGHGDGPMENNNLHDTKRRKSEQHEGESLDRSDRFHISIAWNLEEPDPSWISLIKQIDVNKHLQPPQAAFGVVKARIGNVVHNIDLKSRGSRYEIGGTSE